MRSHSARLPLAALLVLAVAGCAVPDDPADSTDAAASPTAPTTTAPTPLDTPAARSVTDPCTTKDVPVGLVELEIETASGARDAVVYVPRSYLKRRPAATVYNFHGLGGSGRQQLAYGDLREEAEHYGFLVVAPDGEGIPRRWPLEGFDASDGNGSVTFVDTLVKAIESRFCIDPDRRFATGMSYGGVMTSALACRRTEEFAAFAPVAGTIHREGLCQDPVALLAVHGTADELVTFDGSASEIAGAERIGPIPDNVAGFARASGCDPSPQISEFRADVELHDFTCPDDADVRLLAVVDGAHVWPGSPYGGDDDALDASAAVVAFFVEHGL